MNLGGHGIAVFCGSSPGNSDIFMDTARLVGRSLAEREAIVVYGGASVGTMGAVADGALAAGGKVVGVIPDQLMQKELGHPGLTELHVVGTMHQRKALMSERASGYVVLPGGYGTYEELFEVVTWKQLGLHDKPIVIVNVDGFYDAVATQIRTAIDRGFMRPDMASFVTLCTNVPDTMRALEEHATPEKPVAKWV